MEDKNHSGFNQLQTCSSTSLPILSRVNRKLPSADLKENKLRMILELRLVFRLSLCLTMIFAPPLVHSREHPAEEMQEVETTEDLQLEEAFAEQGYYLRRLFLEYGTNGTLTYEGLQTLLGSLGLGEVSVLEFRHGTVKHSSPSPTHLHPSLHVDHHLKEPETPGPGVKGASGEVTAVSGGSEMERDPRWNPETEETRRLLSDHLIKHHVHENCLNVTQLLWNFGLGQTSHITPAHFTFLCPALLYQIDSGVCLRHTDPAGQEGNYSVDFLPALGWASLALLVISLPSLVALGLARLIPPAALRTVLCPMASLAVGTLCGDALLHLLPHASSGPHGEDQDSVLKGLCVLAGLFLLFVFESLLRYGQSYKKSKQQQKQQDVDQVREMVALDGSSRDDRTVSSESGHAHSHGAPGDGSSGLSAISWMIVMGDGIHNLTDGLAIGVAFSQSVTGGLSTTIAVFCHELPHELGDLAVLMAAGWPVRKVALFSLLSVMLGYAGALIGTVLGHQWAQLSPWILTLTAGVFLYIALTDMMPEMLHGERGSLGPLTGFILQCLGLTTGGGIMLCIALFEKNIAVNLGDE